MSERNYREIVDHYERCLDEHGDGAAAVNWKSPEDAALRYDVMLDLVRPEQTPVSVLDFGCGLGDFADHARKYRPGLIDYSGLDISERFVSAARRKHPALDFHCLDVLEDDSALPDFDYIVMNGVFTRSETLDPAAMFAYMRQLLKVVWCHARKGLAFNVMSSHVDWTSPELFHPAQGDMANLVASQLSRHFVQRNDYGLYETTWYAYRQSVKEAKQ